MPVPSASHSHVAPVSDYLDHADCASCRYAQAGVVHARKGTTYWCRRYAPRPGVEILARQWDWPIVKAEDWCGEFMPGTKAHGRHGE